MVHKKRMLMLADNGNIYDLVTHRKILQVERNCEQAALKDNSLVVVVNQHVNVIDLQSKRRRVIEKDLCEYATAIYYGKMLVVGNECGELFIFDDVFNYVRALKIGTEKVPVILYNGGEIIAISFSGEMVRYVHQTNKLVSKTFDTKLTALAVREQSGKRDILLGDDDGFVYFVDEDLSYRRIKISSKRIEYLYFFKSIYCITEGFVRKINEHGARKIYGTVCSVPTKVFSYGQKIFCSSVLVGIQPIVDRKNDFYDRIMKF